MRPFKLPFQQVAIIPPIGLVILYLIMALLNIGEGKPYPSPDLLFALNTLFLTVSGLIVAILSAWSYHSEGDLSLLFLGMATAVGGVLASVAGFAASISVNYNVALFNLGFLFSGGFQLLSAVLIVAGAVPSSQSHRKHLLFLGYVAVTALVIVSTVLVLGGFAPTFFATSGPTAIRQWIIVGAGVLSAVSSVLLGWQYRLSKSKVVFWYALALALLAISLVGLATYKTPNGPYNWATRVSYWLAGVYFLVAILMARPRAGLDSSSELGVSSNWAEAFRNDSRQLENLFSSMFDGFSYHKILVKEGRPVDYIYIAVNDAFEKMTGLNRKDVIGKRVTEILPGIEKDPADWIGVYGKVAITGQPVIFENYAAPLNRWYSVSAYSPRKGYFVAIFEDITARKKAEEALRESEARFHSTLDNMIEGGQIIGLDWRYIYINKAAENQNQRSNEELLGNRYMDVWPGIESTEVFAKLKRCMEERIPQEMENFFVFPNKTTGWFNLKITPVPEGVFILSLDITKRKKAEEAAAKQAELIDLSPDAIIVRKLDGTIIFWSKGAEKLYGWTKEEAIGQVTHKLFKTQFPQPLEEILAKLKADGRWSGEIVHTCKNGDKLVVQSFWLAKFGADGEIFEMLESNVDITDRIELQNKLEESAVRLEEYANQMESLANQRAAQLKDAERLAAIGATAGMVGHDIRNPLQAIVSDVFLAKSEIAGTPDSEQKKMTLESLEEIEKNADYINKIVQDLQDYARPLNPKIEESDLKQIIEAMISKNGLPKNIKVKVKIEDNARKIKADSYYINRILYNLVTNSVQAMPHGGKLTIEARKEAEDILLSIKDTGVGIPKNIQEKMFTLMFTTKSKGQGFGLPVVKRMAESLGGKVTFISEEGKGTTFTVRLPLLKS